MRTIPKAPGQVPLWSEARREALCQRWAEPGGLASDHASWPGRRPEDGVPMASKTVHRAVRDPLRATLKGPRNSPITNS
jgi:hypothetical protein